jgi:hypothetical protein
MLVGPIHTNDATFPLTGGSTGSFAIVITHTSTCGTHVMRTTCKGTDHNLAAQGNGSTPDGPSLSANDDRELRISPNPNDGTFTLDLRNDFREGTVTVVDGQGRQMGARLRLAKGVNQLHYDNLTPGVYLVRVELDGQVRTQNIVITGK